MELSIKYYGSSNGSASKIIEMTIISRNTTIIEDVTSLYGHVDIDLIISLREIADELENQNRLLAETK